MSEIKLAAAKELIQEKRYAEARILLQTINHPTAIKWLAKLDQISPPPNPYPPPPNNQMFNPEANAFYRRENRRANRRRIGRGLQMIGLGIICFFAFGFFAMPTPSIEQGGKMVINLGFSWILIPLGIIAILGGIFQLLHRN